MRQATAVAMITLGGCGTEAPPPILPLPPVPTVDVSAPWRVDRTEEGAVVLRVGDSPDGARVQFAVDARGRQPGVTLIAGGRTLEVDDQGALWPLIGVPYPDRALASVAITSDGPDLVVRIAGPAIRAVTGSGADPDDPVLTWIRVRPRGTSWRAGVDGLFTLTLPPGAEGAADNDGSIALRTGFGAVSFATTAKESASASGGRWSWTNVPALAAFDPYPHATIVLAGR